MNGNPLRIERLAIFSSKRAEKVFKVRRNLSMRGLVRVNRNLADVFRNVIKGTRKGIGIIDHAPGRNVRAHTFSSAAVKTLCDGIRHSSSRRDFGINALKLARMYYKTKMSRGAALFIFKIIIQNESFVVIYSSEYLENTAGFSTRRIIESLTDVFIQGFKKGIVYPFIDLKGNINPERVLVIQKESYAEYWWKFMNLNENMSREKTLDKQVIDDEKKLKKEVIFDKQYVTSICKNPKIGNSFVSIVCDTIEIKLRMNQLYTDVVPEVVNGNGRIVIKKGNCRIRVPRGESRRIKYQ